MLGQSISHYKILEKLGEGGMGVVYKAEDTRLRRSVALKFLPPDLTRESEAKERFIKEAQAAAALNHSNICTIYEINESDDRIFIAMEYLEGQDLKDRITSGPMKLSEVIGIGTQVAEGLREAHEKNIVHRDIKPANIMITAKGQTKVMDFGLAKLGGQTKITREGTTLGTVSYMSPEQARGDEVDHRSDIWSLGIVLYETVTGKPPFKGEYEQAVMYSIMNDDPEPLTGLRTGVPLEFERIILKCIEKNPAERYQTATDLLADFHHLQRITAAPAPPSKPKSSRPIAVQTILRIAWTAALILIVTVGTVLLVRQFIPSLKKVIPERIMLVVLPFENLGQPEDEYFADGITEEITSRLASLHGLGVISRTSAFHYKKTNKTIKQIGKELKVDYVLEGTVRWERAAERPNRVRVTPQLIRVSDDTHLWTERYDEQLDEIFAVQSNIAEEVVRELNVSLLEPEKQNLAERPTEDLDAYQAYLKGLEYSERGVYSEEDRRLRVKLFQRAVELDSNFALAWAALSRAHLDLINLGMDRTQKRADMAKVAIDRIFELHPDSPEAHLALGYYFYYVHRDYDQALEEFALAGKGLPNDSDVLGARAWIRRRQGHWNEAIDFAKQAFVLDPRDSGLARELGNLHSAIHKHVEAIEFYNRSIALAPDQQAAYVLKAMNYWFGWGDLKQARESLEAMPQRTDAFSGLFWFLQELYERKFESALNRIASAPIDIFEAPNMFYPKSMLEGFVYRFLGQAEQSRGALENAQQTLEQELKEHPNDARIRSSLGMVYAALNRREEAIREGKLAVELLPVSLDALHGPSQVEALAMIYMLVGDHEAALDKIEYLLSIPSSMTAPFLRIDPQWDPLREHPRFHKLMAKYSKAES
jgi:serine/threonine protein kinase/tetratricopeptide (TPR) repeat protein